MNIFKISIVLFGATNFKLSNYDHHEIFLMKKSSTNATLLSDSTTTKYL